MTDKTEEDESIEEISESLKKKLYVKGGDEAIEKIVDSLKNLYAKEVVPFSKSDDRETFLIRDKDGFTKHILSDPSNSEDNAKLELLKKLFTKTTYSNGVTTFIDGLSSTSIGTAHTATYDGYAEVTRFDLPIVEEIDSYVDKKYARKQPAARGTVLHHMLQRHIVSTFSCYSPIPISDIPEASDRAKDIPSMLERLAAQMQLEKFRFMALEFPVYLRRCPVLTPDKGVWKWLVGKIDLLAWHEEYGVCLMDFKFTTSKRISRKHAVQLSLLALCLISMGISVDSLFIVSVNIDGKKSYTCRICLVTFVEEYLRIALSDNDPLKRALSGEEDLKTFRSFTDDLTGKLAKCIRTSKSVIEKKFNLRERKQ